MPRGIHRIYFSTPESQAWGSGDENWKDALEKRRGAASLIGWYRRWEEKREHSMVLDVFVRVELTVADGGGRERDRRREEGGRDRGRSE